MKTRNALLRLWILRAISVLIVGLTTSPAVFAATVTIDYTDSGWYNLGTHSPSNTNYTVGRSGAIEHRNFFVFDLSAISGTVNSATLRLYNPAGGFFSNEPSETYSLFEVSTPIATLLAGTSPASVFGDLGSGTTYGAVTLSASHNDSIVSMTLNLDALAAIQASVGGLFAVGGALTTLDSSPNEAVFGFSSFPEYSRQLVLETASVPEPSVIALLTLGVVILVGKSASNRKADRQ